MPSSKAILGLLVTVTMSTVGCASRSEPPRLTTVTEVYGSQREHVGEPIAASALVFAAPVAMNEAGVSYDRSSRQPGAFFGYDEGSIETYRLTVDDRQSFSPAAFGAWRWGGSGGGYWGGYGGGGWADRYERRAYSERVGSYRR